MAEPPRALKIEQRPEQIDNPVLRFYLDYWERKRAGRTMPSRADIRASELKPHIGAMVLLEALPGRQDFKYRLVGTRVSEVFLADATGLTLRQAYARAGASQEFTDSVVRTHRIVCEKRVPIRITGGHGEWRGRFYPAYDALYLPLSDDGVEANMVLNVCTFTPRSVDVADDMTHAVVPVT